jgi:DNA-binding transcriptional MerR regulator
MAALRAGRKVTGDKDSSAANAVGWSVEELAEVAGTTVRNLRAFQDRGVIPPPAKRGRIAVYGDAHLYRLRLVLRLQARGYSLHSIGELIDAAESGRDVRELIGLDTAITAPLSPSPASPATMTRAQLLKLFGLKRLPRGLLERAIKLEFIAPEGARYRVGNILILEAAADIVRSGIGLSDLLDLADRLRTNMERTADDVTWRLAKAIDSYGNRIPPAEDMPRIAELIQKLRRLVDPVLLAEGHRAIERSAAELYSERLARTMKHVASD